MFTGIVREIGTVVARHRQRGLMTLAIAGSQTANVARPMESVAVHGVCLTVVSVRAAVMTFEVIPETQRLTSLQDVRVGARVHLEPSLSLTDRLQGHVVLGHVDGLGTVVERQQRRGELVLTVRIGPALRSWLVPKGPVAVDGVSLTVGARLTPTTFTLHLIPETLRRTLLGTYGVGQRVNVEADYLAKVLGAQRRRSVRTSRSRAGR